MIPFTCSNCCYNGLQYGSLGLSAGFCVEHRKVLRRADETTCGRQFRKDLPLPTAEECSRTHQTAFDEGTIRFVRTKAAADLDPTAVQTSTAFIETDSVGEAVSDYGVLPTKIASLAQLKSLPGLRAELALFSLGRSYVRRCGQRGGAWTSGINLLWWARKRFETGPQITVNDLRYQTAAPIERQAELVAWSVLMLRLTFVSDVGELAPLTEPASGLRTIAESAALATETPSLPALLDWLRGEGTRLFDSALPVPRMRTLREQLHREREPD